MKAFVTLCIRKIGLLLYGKQVAGRAPLGLHGLELLHALHLHRGDGPAGREHVPLLLRGRPVRAMQASGGIVFTAVVFNKKEVNNLFWSSQQVIVAFLS